MHVYEDVKNNKPIGRSVGEITAAGFDCILITQPNLI
jgi:hypothetical protein